MRSSAIRIFVYIFSLVLLALGLTLNVQTGLGVSPIVSVAFSASAVTGIAFADATFILYSLFVVVEVIVHTTIRKKERIEVVKDLLQLPLSLVFTRFMALFQIIIPDVSAENMAIRLLVLLAAITATGMGAAGSLSMRLVPNPGDGIVRTLAELIGRSVGFTKNLFDGINVSIAILIGLVFTHSIPGVGLGTILAFIGVGRAVSLYNTTIGRKVMLMAFPDGQV